LFALYGYFLYYEGKTDEAERALKRALELSANQADEEPMIISAMLHASLGQRERIDPRVFAFVPEKAVDGDTAEWIASIYALLGEKQKSLAWFRRALQVGNHNYPWFQRDKNWDKLRSDSEFQSLMQEAKQHWEQYTQLFGDGKF
jgi:tetratricopeptide (TPR) repeat protein